MILYAAIGSALHWYKMDVDGAMLRERGAVQAMANVQYAWPHVSGRFLYVASSDSARGRNAVGTRHFLQAFRVATDGALTAHGEAVPLPARPIHISTDMPSAFLLAAFSNPAALRIYRIHADGTLGGEVAQETPVRTGIFPHQVMVTPDNRLAILVTRGNDAAGERAEEPGALQVFRYRDGQLTETDVVAPAGGYGFGPRHLDFHPERPWVYLSMERQNRLEMFRIEGEALSPQAVFQSGTLAGAAKPLSGQRPGPIHMHPSGRWIYVANRADHTVIAEGRRVFTGGENSVAVFAVAPETGEPVAIQHMDTRGFHCRTFAIDPGGRMLVAAHVAPMLVRDGGAVREEPAGLSVFRIGEDGRLAFARRYPVDVGGANLFWVGIAA